MTDGMVHTWESVAESISRAVGRKAKVLSIPPMVADGLSRLEVLRASLFGSKPLLTPDRITELSQSSWTCDDTRARLDIEYESSISLPDGFRMTADWYRAQGWL